MKYIVPLLLTLFASLSTGCVSQLKSEVSPGADLKALKKIHVVHLPGDQRGIEKLLADRLNQMGFQATAGEKSAQPADAQATVTYQDKWMWDITMYMLSLNVEIRQPKTEFVMAKGHALHTSMARKSPPEMVAEVLNDVFK
jgi:hypothetical protein